MGVVTPARGEVDRHLPSAHACVRGWDSMTTTVPGSGPDTAPHLAAVVRVLAAGGADSVADALELARRSLGFDELVLRDPATPGVAARAAAVPPQREPSQRWVLDAPVRAGARVVGVLSAASSVPFSPD